MLAADHEHYTVLRRLAAVPEAQTKIRMIRSFDPTGPRGDALSIDDPWFGDDSSFDRTYAEVFAAADGVVDFVREQLASTE